MSGRWVKNASPSTLPVAWLVALVASAGFLATVLVFTQDLAITDARLAQSVSGVRTASDFTAQATALAGDLAPAVAALEAGGSEVESIGSSLTRTVAALEAMQADLGRLGGILDAVGPPAAAAVDLVDGAQANAAGAASATGGAADGLGQVANQLGALGPLFDETVARAARIESKLRILRLGS